MEILLIILRFLCRWFPGIARRLQLRPVPKRPGQKQTDGPVVITVPLLGLTFVLPQFRGDPAHARPATRKATTQVAQGRRAARRIDSSSLLPPESNPAEAGDRVIPQELGDPQGAD